ncbi:MULTISPECIES: hypothetical protein [unclassified Mesorhizobium]|uniref:hypothetical protein n=1 Tax=unclassified Mesorhizobium TaxID=325217 RepID=UPI0003CE4CD7|nr:MULTISPECIES: hypothetical protein [unclassified Mesorhizobium]ESY52081.1 hypothetical protein X745_21005 [Mesorhizobium sp. LNJC374B00]ESY55976.1 hypothetical protein X744_22365 [Mesorhizobium sp. LNJC372A00]WJI81279.1 hypothetical protein NLY34_00495 [Mesorhizobium sp. C374B]WJI87798.1 hypothetical protein NLY42_02910 [Mesorhizobium sp. C372A]
MAAFIALVVFVILGISFLVSSAPHVRAIGFLSVCIGLGIWLYWLFNHSEWAKDKALKARHAAEAAEKERIRQEFEDRYVDVEDFLTTVQGRVNATLGKGLPDELYEPILNAQVKALRHFKFEREAYQRYVDASVRSLVGFTLELLPSTKDTDSIFVVPLLDVIKEQGRLDALVSLAKPFRDMSAEFRGSPYDTTLRAEDPKLQKEWDKLDDKLIKEIGYPAFASLHTLENTPYEKQGIRELFNNFKVPFVLEDKARFQHTWIISPTGTGKTSLIENLILLDVGKIIHEGASVIVMDSQNQMIPRLLSVFHPVNSDRVILLEPNPKHPLALNLFDNRAIDYGSSLEMADFILTSLLGADMTAKQAGIFRYLAQAMQVIPDATILDFKEFLKEGGYLRYRPHLQKLDPYTLDFFETRYNTTDFKPTRGELFWRLDAIMSDPTFRDMFSSPRNRLNLSAEVDQGKLICINTNLKLLKSKGTEVFGRYFLALINQVIEGRLDAKNPPPLYVYVDECHDYIANEPMIEKFMDKARKQNVAFTFAHQRLNNIKSPDVRDALTTARVKYAGRSERDAPFVASILGVSPETLTSFPADPPFQFAFNQGKATTILTNRHRFIDKKMERHDNYAEYQKAMYERYCVLPGHDPFKVATPIKVSTPEPRQPTTQRQGEADIDPVPE